MDDPSGKAMQALVATQSPAFSTLKPSNASEAYAVLKLSSGARRKEIRRAYLRCALASHPDKQQSGTSDGEAFQRIKAAYELLMEHTQHEALNARLEEVDAELEAQYRELNELERKRRAREGRIQALVREKEVAKDRQRQQQRKEWDAVNAAARRTDHRIDSEAVLQAALLPQGQQLREALAQGIARDEETQAGPPEAVMLTWDAGGSPAEMLLTRETVLMGERQLFAWISTDRQICITPHPMPSGSTFWLLTFYQMSVQYALHSILPVNSARKYRWEVWHHLALNLWTGFLEHRGLAPLNSRAVRQEELDDRKRWATTGATMQAEMDRLKQAEAALIAEVHADDRKQEEEKRRLKSLEEKRRAAEKRKNDAERVAARELKRRAEEEQVRELEYQDAEWQLFLKDLAAAMAQHKEEVKGARMLGWVDRVAAKRRVYLERKELKRKWAEKEAERDAAKAVARQTQAQQARDTAAREAETRRPPQPRAATGVEAPLPSSSSPPDVDTLSIRELKQLIISAGLSTEGCIEKADLRERAREALAPKSRSEPPEATAANSSAADQASVPAATTIDDTSSTLGTVAEGDSETVAIEASDAAVAGEAAVGEAAAGEAAEAEAVAAEVAAAAAEDAAGEAAAAKEAAAEDAAAEAAVAKAPWYPRPRGAAPKGPGGVRQVWSHALGCWEPANSGGAAPQLETSEAEVKMEAEEAGEIEVAEVTEEVEEAVEVEEEGVKAEMEDSASVQSEVPSSNEQAARPVQLEKGTRVRVYWHEDGKWFNGCVVSWGPIRGHRIQYDDRSFHWEHLEHMQWQRLTAEGTTEAENGVTNEESPMAVAADVRNVTRSMRRDIKVRVFKCALLT